MWHLYEMLLAQLAHAGGVQAMAPGMWNPSAALAAPPEAHSSGSKRNKLGQHRRKNGRWTQEETQLLIELTNKVRGAQAALPAGLLSACSVPGPALIRAGARAALPCLRSACSTPEIKSTCTSHDPGALRERYNLQHLSHVALSLVACWAPSALLKPLLRLPGRLWP